MRAKANLRNWLGFLMLRKAPDAQWEIRQYADIVGQIVESIWPRTYALFLEHDFKSVRLSNSEVERLAYVLDGLEVSLREEVGKTILAKFGLK
jgi:thymidylate synthase (FAD)